MTDYIVFHLWGFPVMSFIFAGAGAYLGSYLKKKGENLATKEDLNDLKAQTAVLTQTTKEIESKIEDQMWNRQRQWELKRDTLLEAARCVADVDAMLVRVDAVMKTKSQQQPEASNRVQTFLLDKQNESTKALNDADNALSRAYMAVAVVGSVKVRSAFNFMIAVLRRVSAKVLSEGAVDEYTANRPEIQRMLDNLVSAIRAELGTIATEHSEGG